LELGQFKVNGWAGVLLNYPMNLRKLTKREIKKGRKNEGEVRKERRQKGGTKQLKKVITG